MNAANNKNRPLQMINQTDVRPLTGYFTHDRIAVPNPLPEAPERPERLDVIERNMLALGMDALVRVHYAKPAPIESVILAHDLEYVRRLEAASAGDPAALATFDAPDTRVGPDTFDAAMKSAGAVVEAVDELYAGRIKNAFCGVRPPGHHAARAEARGFCYLNNVAIGAYWAMRRHGARRVVIVDFDAHHGDGTEEIVANHPDIRFMSLFQWPLYPHRMMEPTPKNVVVSPVAAGADGAVFTDILENVWLPQLEAFRPDIIFVSAGFDAHVEEQMAQLKVKELDYARITRRLLDAADVSLRGASRERARGRLRRQKPCAKRDGASQHAGHARTNRAIRRRTTCRFSPGPLSRTASRCARSGPGPHSTLPIRATRPWCSRPSSTPTS